MIDILFIALGKVTAFGLAFRLIGSLWVKVQQFLADHTHAVSTAYEHSGKIEKLHIRLDESCLRMNRIEDDIRKLKDLSLGKKK